ncbi:response regulator receiver protein [Scytonema hofmannii PCC 7110]|uniref:Response regulator receiver protein n=1 Tax=Scytonema hofmannii PCC 7110 TaxID=128403 RepID=A0A139XCJ9_9CYAN|nr:response regulator [Scytonema hofmannii]KYC42420.1 response regulator receiver protein [Scytonema hofmannii PCC 7110]
MDRIIKRILICDDNADNSFLLQAILEAEEREIEIADSGAAVLTKIETDSDSTDLLILDVMMPEMDGYEIAQRIRQSDKFQSLPILLVTGISEDYSQNYRDVKVDGLIRKPIDIDLVIAQVEAILHPSL